MKLGLPHNKGRTQTENKMLKRNMNIRGRKLQEAGEDYIMRSDQIREDENRRACIMHRRGKKCMQ
jgi:hypothetical protein